MRSAFTLCLAALAAGHSYLVAPLPDWQFKFRAHCRQGGPHGEDERCAGPCIAPDSPFLSPNAPTTVWRRGEPVRVAWNRNTHSTGFVRLSLVPLADRMNATAHRLAAFHFACFDAERVPCTQGFCGTDKVNFQLWVFVPSVPDGLYVLGWAWFGAVALNPGFRFGDYYSCANIHVHGGAVPPLSRLPPRAPQPMWPCLAAANRLGVCLVEPCRHLAARRRWMCPHGWLFHHSRCVYPSPIATRTPSPTHIHQGGSQYTNKASPELCHESTQPPTRMHESGKLHANSTLVPLATASSRPNSAMHSPIVVPPKLFSATSRTHPSPSSTPGEAAVASCESTASEQRGGD